MTSTRHRLKGLRLDELSLVDRPANAQAKVALWKRGSAPVAEINKADRARLVDVCKALFDGRQIADFRLALSEELRQQNIMEVNEKMWPLMDALRESVMTTVSQMSGEDRDEKIRENVEAFIEAVRAKLDGATMEKAMSTMKAMHGDKDKMSDAEKKRMKELMDKEGYSEKEAMSQAMREMRKNTPDDAAGSPGTTHASKENEGMTPDELAKRLGDLETQVDQLTKQAKDHGLEVTKADDGSVTLTKKAEEEYVEIGGERVAKSAVPAGVLKAIEQQNDQIAKMQQAQEIEILRKRAQTEIPNLSGSDDAKGQLLKAIDGLDAEVAKTVRESLSAADKAVSKLFSEVGKSVADDESSATYRLNKMAQDRATKNGEAYETAYAEVTKSDEGKRLLRESRTEQAN